MNLETIKLSEESANAMTLEVALSCLQEIGVAERHFNNLEAKYRSLASTWLLAGLGGMGYVLTNSARLEMFSAEITIALVGLATSVGIILLWILDQMVYHRLLDSFLLEGLRIELEFPQLPQARKRMAQFCIENGKPRIPRMLMPGSALSFYLSAALVPLIVGVIPLFSNVRSANFASSLIVFLLAAVLFSSIVYLAIRTPNQWHDKDCKDILEEYDVGG